MVDLRQARLRSNPRLHLVPYDCLPSAQRDALSSLSTDRDFFGILKPEAGSGLTAKSVSRDAALLFLTLREPACLPSLLTNLLGTDAEQRLHQLVLDQVFEVELSGRFVSGADALGLFDDRTDLRIDSRIARLSSEAIDYAQTLDVSSIPELSARLYAFNAAPATPQVYRRFSSDDGVRAFVCAQSGTQRELQSNWRSESIRDGWFVWSGSSSAPAAYKLYVSPVLEELPRVFSIAIAAFMQADCRTFKLGRGVYGLLRPDKLVGHFSGLDQLHRAAELIAAGADGAVAQGVPFSAPIDAAGLISWGIDPPRFRWVPEAHSILSWRLWLSQRIAMHVAAARASGGDVQAFVRKRIGLDGVDTTDWTPNLAIWRDVLGTEEEAA